MNWLRRLRGWGRKLSDDEQVELAKYRELPTVDPSQELLETRIVVLDVETSGLNPFRDRLLSIGAVIVNAGAIRVGNAIETVLRQRVPSDHHNILVHGIDGTTQLEGSDHAEALLGFLAYAGTAPVVGYHADFDRVMIERAVRRSLGIKLRNDWLDLARLLPALFPEHAKRGAGLDYWLAAFAIENFARHAALADAYATAQLLLVALDRAAATGHTRYGALRRLDDDQRWLEQTLRSGI